MSKAKFQTKTEKSSGRKSNSRSRASERRESKTNGNKQRRSEPSRQASDDAKMCNWQESEPNDWRWYALDEQLLKDTASIPYSWPTGNRVNLSEYAGELNDSAFPGVLSMYLTPTIGWTDKETDPINIAMRNIYSYVRHANAGHTNYEAPDYFMYLLAMDSVYSYHAWLKRVYGCMMLYSTENKYYPRGVIDSMNVDFESIQANLAQFRTYINLFAVKAGSLCVPASMSYFAKHMWMYSGIYTDGLTAKSQIYMFNPVLFGKFEAFETGGSKLIAVPMVDRPEGRFKYEDLIELGNTLLNPLITNEDIGIMSGDTLKAFGPENLFKITGITEDYTVLPAYEPEVLDQIQNATLVGYPIWADAPSGDSNVMVSQNTDIGGGFLVSEPYFYLKDRDQDNDNRPAGLSVLASNRIVTFDYDNVEPYQTMEATRLTNIIDPASIEFDTEMSYWKYRVTTLGSEVACFARVFFYGQPAAWTGADDTWALLNTERFYTPHDLSFHGESVERVITSFTEAFNYYNILITKVSAFDRHPMMVCVARALDDSIFINIEE